MSLDLKVKQGVSSEDPVLLSPKRPVLGTPASIWSFTFPHQWNHDEKKAGNNHSRSVSVSIETLKLREREDFWHHPAHTAASTVTEFRAPLTPELTKHTFVWILQAYWQHWLESYPGATRRCELIREQRLHVTISQGFSMGCEDVVMGTRHPDAQLLPQELTYIFSWQDA